MSTEAGWTDQDAEAIANLSGEEQRLAIIARGFEPVDISLDSAGTQYCPGARLPLRDERAYRLRLAFEAVYERWMHEWGDVHDAWNPGDLVGAALDVLKEYPR